MIGKSGGRKVLIVDDEESVRRAVASCLRKLYAEVEGVSSTAELFMRLESERYDVLVMDVFLKDEDSLTHLSRLRSEYPGMQVLIMTGQGTIDMAVEALRRGAYDFVTKPIDPQRLVDSVRGASQLARKESDRRQAPMERRPPEIQELLGQSPAMEHLKKLIGRVADSDRTVLIVGETGSGKELVAQAIHRASSRGRRAMAEVNCAALPGELVESEIFGHERGAFTSAGGRKIGFAERANGSTLFLDEIGEMPLELQPKLLRFLQNKTFYRVGGTERIQVDTRIVCATNVDPNALLERGLMREDLFYRISPVTLRVPSLRERKSDIPLLARVFLERLAAEEQKSFQDIDEQAMGILVDYHWPGNVRQLLNVLTETVVFHDGPRMSEHMLPTGLVASVRDRHALDRAPRRDSDEDGGSIRPLWKMEKEAMRIALERCNGNVTKAAEQLDISAATFYRKIKQYNLERTTVR